MRTMTGRRTARPKIPIPEKKISPAIPAVEATTTKNRIITEETTVNKNVEITATHLLSERIPGIVVFSRREVWIPRIFRKTNTGNRNEKTKLTTNIAENRTSPISEEAIDA